MAFEGVAGNFADGKKRNFLADKLREGLGFEVLYHLSEADWPDWGNHSNSSNSSSLQQQWLAWCHEFLPGDYLGLCISKTAAGNSSSFWSVY